jgi:phosphoribosyl-ATP pyrophosphohydrolase/phosphoribosyl-AMP cyclohydrolase
MLEELRFGEDGLLPVVAQDLNSGAVLMLAWANREAIELTLRTGWGTYYSRSRRELWIKGATSGNRQRVVSVLQDCDADSLLYQVEQRGPACHTGQPTCFHVPILGSAQPVGQGVLERIYETVLQRLAASPQDSYVARLHQGGIDRILRKVAEEAGEFLLAAKNGVQSELQSEAADLVFHVLLALAECGLGWDQVLGELGRREGRSGLKPPKPAG